MDDDLQHHPKYLPAMRRELEKGFDVVYESLPDKCALNVHPPEHWGTLPDHVWLVFY